MQLLPILVPSPPTLGLYHSAFYFCGFTYSGYFRQMDSYDMCPFVCGFFYLA